MVMIKTWEEGKAEARAEARAEALAEARTEARAEAQAKAALTVLTVLRVRGIAVPEAARARILAQQDLHLLERWLEKAIIATSIDDVLTDPS